MSSYANQRRPLFDQLSGQIEHESGLCLFQFLWRIDGAPTVCLGVLGRQHAMALSISEAIDSMLLFSGNVLF
ncbi:hypothetical protein GWO43_25750 [candidate division KSB1 bacterium]|nr:hypothetical protein [candidate division KSB1 bacterium]NIR69217.1 hypothetical protein [candidate division KSB1 bacterium]NIS27391.1 hypothetical protein [candidate division KSB1 bacterium]NIT74216.1 hypothetical protein [candidate division KSB1 bacterium]NIU28108.1 hypothetical protein [candidate division KSB1 bacterium]